MAAVLVMAAACGQRNTRNASAEAVEMNAADSLELKYAPKIEIGTTVEDFTARTIDGTDFTFSSLKGSYIVLDFWASWCPDCREEIPAVRELRDEFEPKGVKFVSFSVDDSEEAWKSAVAEEQMDWLQVSNLIKWKENPVANFFGMGWIPTMFLIGPDGKIAGFALTASRMRTLLEDTAGPLAEQMVGAYSEPREIAPEELEMFKKATADLSELQLVPQNVATQVVAGINYKFFCDCKEGYNLSRCDVIVYKPLSGEPSVTKINMK